MNFTPNEIVRELDRYIIGQKEAKRAVAIALRNRYRRSMLDKKLQDEITPKNIIMQGPTGVGKTEIARRLAKIVAAPFLKVEATKYTEVGYVGRDVESMIRDLVTESVRLVREEKYLEIEDAVTKSVRKKVLSALIAQKRSSYKNLNDEEYKQHIKDLFKKGELDNEIVEMSLPVPPKVMPALANLGVDVDFNDVFGLDPGKKKKKAKVEDVIKTLKDAEFNKMIDEESINTEALKRAANMGIIFIDEIDKIASKNKYGGIDVSREGVQRDILPIVEGSTVMTKFGAIKTDHILFIASGAFHLADITDLIPELQGRFPVVVKLDALTEEDFVNILKTSDNALLKQYAHLLGVDKVKLVFTDEAILQIAKIAAAENEANENIGARRLFGVMEKLLNDISYAAGNLNEEVEVVVDQKYVLKHLEDTISKLDLGKYIL